MTIGEDQRHYALLPKMNASQLLLIEHRLAASGYSVARDKALSARKGGASVHIDPAGVCWSNTDVTDLVAPAVPDILKATKTIVPLSRLALQYFYAKRNDRGFTIRLSLRMESSKWWRELRSTNQSALAPDEHAVVAFLLSRSKGKCSVLTDFPSESCRVTRIGKTQYYDSSIDASEAALHLRSTSIKGSRSVYVPKDGKLLLQLFRPPNRRELTELLSGLGDWCGYAVR